MHILILALILIITLSAPVWVFIITASLYALWRIGYPLLVIGFIVDALWGGGVVSIPFLYTLIAGGIILIAELIKPYLRYYENT